MSPLLYWTIFSVLVCLLIVFLSYILINIIWDLFLSESNEETTTPDVQYQLNKYHFDKHDVEDLTRIEKDFKTVIPNVSFSNEVNDTAIKESLGRKYSLYESESTIDKSEISVEKDEKDEEDGTRQTFSEMNKISRSVDDLEFCDPNSIDTLKELAIIEKDAEMIEGEIAVFEGGINDLRFYEINEKLIRLMISLSYIYCEREELRKRKSSILEYVQECQKKLKNSSKLNS